MDAYTPVRDLRTFRWCDNVLKFPCGIKINITAEKINKIFGMFKIPKNGEELVSTGQTTMPKGVAFQIKGYLT